MIPSELRSYLVEHRRATLVDMAHHFDSDAEALRGMLAILERKGRVRKLQGVGCSSGCGKCDQAGLELYELIDG